MRSRIGGRLAFVAAAAVPVLVLVVFFLVPVAGMLAKGFWVDGEFDPGAVVEVLGRPRVHRVLWFTLWSATLATVVTVALGVPLAFVLYVLRFPGRGFLRALVTMPFVLPTVVVGVAFRTLLADSGPLGALGLDGSATAIVAALVFFNIAVVVRTVGTHWASTGRRREEAAAALGATPWQVLRTVTLPALRPSIVGAASVVFLFCATSFGVVLTLGGVRYATVETEIYLLTTQFLDLPAAAALSILQILVVTGLLYVAARTRSQREPTTERDVRGVERRPGLRDLPVLTVATLVVTFLLLPLATLVLRSTEVDGGHGFDNYRMLQTAGESQGLAVPVTTALANSLRIAVDATLLAVGLGVIVAALVTRQARTRAARRARGLLDGLFLLPLGVSAVTVGFGLLITLNRPPLDLRGSLLLVPIAQAMVALPLVVRTLVPAIRAIDDRQRQAAASLGAGPLRVLLAVDLPLTWQPLLAATGFAFAISFGEFGATVFLARADYPTLPVLVYQLISRPTPESFGLALAASVVLAATTVVVMGVVERLRVSTTGAW